VLHWHRTLIVISSLLIAGSATGADFFSEKVAPLLEQHCVSCHNAKDLKGGFSLIDGKSAMQGGESGPVISAHDPASSYLLDLITPADGKAEMPKGRAPLKPTDIAIIRKWIATGAKWPAGFTLNQPLWWSLQPLSKPALPQLSQQQLSWCKTPVDRFVIKKLQEKNLTPAPAADARTLIRRVTYDLTGLPPKPNEVREFISAYQQAPDAAYEQLVDRLLASPQYGEQLARRWLDVVHYGETHGYDKDKPRRNAWPYRDYVINSFNADKPYDRFVQEQIAGDVIARGKPEGIVALGFLAAGPWDFIAHYEVGERKLDGRIAKHNDRDDMVSLTFNTFMSTTVQCSQCHNHKFEPITMTDYYRLHAVFSALDRADRVYDLDPQLQQQRLDLARQIRELKQQQKDITLQIATAGGQQLKALSAKIAELKAKTQIKQTPAFGYHSALSQNQHDEKWVQVAVTQPAAVRHIRLLGAYDDYNSIGAGFGFPVRFRIETAADQKFTQNVTLIRSFTEQDFPNPSIVPVEIEVPDGIQAYLRITATKLATRNNDFIFALAELEALDADGSCLIQPDSVSAKDSIEQRVRWKKSNLIDGKTPAAIDPAAMQELNRVQNAHRQLLAKIMTAEIVESQTDLQAQRELAEQKLSALPKGKLVYAAATHFEPFGQVKPTEGQPRAIHLLQRGDLRYPQQKVQPGTVPLWDEAPSKFDLPTDHTEGQRRVALARYLTDKANPLTWRSIVNRIWLNHFGRGIVNTPNDFGRMGMQPTHPQLLNWLAHWFRNDAKQSLKNLNRMIVLSATYRQNATGHAANTKTDADNMYYWRFNRRRLRAEELRDTILAVSGKLDLKMGGPSFEDFVFQNGHTPKYQYEQHDHNDPATHRRSIYRMIVRSQTQPFMTTFDCADPSMMVARRDVTTTPLQALALLNNSFVITMCDAFAGRLNKQEDPITTAYWLAFSRPPTDAEQTRLTAFIKEYGLANFARLLFNLNEFVYVD